MSAYTFEITGIDRDRSQCGICSGERPNQVHVRVPHRIVDNPKRPTSKNAGATGFFDIRDFNQLTTTQTMEIKKQIQKLIQDMHITEYCTLMDYLLQDGYNDMYQVACNNTLFFDRYISSKRNLIKESLQKIDEFLH